MRLTGKVVNWYPDKAFGFIAPNAGGDKIFIHKNALANRNRSPKINDIVSFSVVKDNQGRYCADQAIFSGEKRSNKAKKQNPPTAKFSICLAILFMIALTAGFFLQYLPQNIVFIYLGLSVITFFAYALDKSKAQRGQWRIQESTLHWLALLGGWPGAAVAQQVLRHKSKKTKFRMVFWCTVLLNTLALGWLITTQNTKVLMFFT